MNKSEKFFPQRPKSSPTIYAYELEGIEKHIGLLKVGYTCRNAKERVAEQVKTARLQFKIHFEESAMRNNGTAFTDHDVHSYLIKKGVKRVEGEWFRCTKKDIEAAILSIKSGIENEDNRTLDFKMRPEQEEAVNRTVAYFNSCKKEKTKKAPHYLWNAKMRFGKTFTAYQLATKMGWKKLLVLTFKPAVQSAWYEDLSSHLDFKDWQFISPKGLSIENADKKNHSFVSAHFKIIWARMTLGELNLKTNGYMK